MKSTVNRRFVLRGLIAAPAIVAVTSIMPVKVLPSRSILERWAHIYGTVRASGELDAELRQRLIEHISQVTVIPARYLTGEMLQNHDQADLEIWAKHVVKP